MLEMTWLSSEVICRPDMSPFIPFATHLADPGEAVFSSGLDAPEWPREGLLSTAQ